MGEGLAAPPCKNRIATETTIESQPTLRLNDDGASQTRMTTNGESHPETISLKNRILAAKTNTSLAVVRPCSMAPEVVALQVIAPIKAPIIPGNGFVSVSHLEV